MEETPADDKRLDFIADYVLRTLKLKEDKWQKCVSSEENRQTLQEFLDKSERRTLVVALSAAGLLQPAAGFSGASRNKAVYFVKRGTTLRLSPESMRDSLVCGDLSYAPLDQFSALVEEVSSIHPIILLSPQNLWSICKVFITVSPNMEITDVTL